VLSLDTFIGAAAVVALWLLVKTADAAFKGVAARTGKIDYIKAGCGFYCMVETADGRQLEALFDPDNMFTDQLSVDLKCSGDLYNDTDTQLLLTHPKIRFMAPDGCRVTFNTPKVYVNGEPATTITVPAHGKSVLTFIVTIARDSLRDYYAHTIPVLDIKSVAGKQYSFRLATTSFYGEHFAYWPRKGKLPVYSKGEQMQRQETAEPDSTSTH